MKRIIGVVLLLTALLMTTGCYSTNTDVSTGKKLRLEKSGDIKEKTVDAVKIDLANDIGNITLNSSTEEVVSIHTVAVVRGQDQTKLDKIHDNIVVSIKQTDKTIKIRVIPKEKPNMEFSQWIHNYYKGYEVEVNLDITIPNTVSEYKVQNDIGNISFSDLTGEFDIELDIGNITGEKIAGKLDMDLDIGNVDIDNLVGSIQMKVNIGDIRLKSVEFTGDSDITTDTGSINTDIKKLDGVKNISFDANIGDINLDFAKDLSYELQLKQFMEKEKTDIVNGGDTMIKAESDVGKIKIKNK